VQLDTGFILRFVLMALVVVVFQSAVEAQGERFGSGHFRIQSKLAAEADLSSMRSLAFVGQEEDSILSALANSQHLVEVAFVDCSPTQKVLTALTAHASTLTTVEVRGQSTRLQMNAAMAATFAQFTVLRNVRIDQLHVPRPPESPEVTALRDQLAELKIEELVEQYGSDMLEVFPTAHLRRYIGGVISDDSMPLLAAASGSLEELTVGTYSLSETGFAILGKCGSLRSLTLRRSFDGVPLEAAAVRHLSRLQRLEDLTLGEFNISLDVLAGTLSSLPQLERLHLMMMGGVWTQTSFGTEGMRVLGSSRSLRAVRFSACQGLTDEGILALCKGGLEHLDVQDSSWELHSSLLKKLGEHAALRTLGLPMRFSDSPEAGVEPNDEWWGAFLGGLASNQSLTQLKLWYSGPPEALGVLSALAMLESLEVSGPAGGELSAADLEFLLNLPRLRRLKLSYSWVRGDVGEVLSRCLALRELVIRWYSDEVEPLTALLEQLSPRQLKVLRLDLRYGVWVDDAELRMSKAIARLSGVRELQFLTPDGVGNESVETLTAMPHLSALSIVLHADIDVGRFVDSLEQCATLRKLEFGIHESRGGSEQSEFRAEDARRLLEATSLAQLTTILDDWPQDELLAICTQRPDTVLENDWPVLRE
jgi:hypothetical protein